MNSALAASALLMGLAGSPHCLAMCGAACTGVASACAGAGPRAPVSSPLRALGWLHAGRIVGYALAGAAVAASAIALADGSRHLALLRPFWAMLHLGAVALGLMLLCTGRQPRWLAGLGQGVQRCLRASSATGGLPGQAMLRLEPRRRPVHAGFAGLAWAAWPCGLLQSALLMAALSSSPAQGAVLMALFASGSAIGLWLGPWAWGRWGQGGVGGLSPRSAVRLAGGLLAGASAWALAHGLWIGPGALLC